MRLRRVRWGAALSVAAGMALAAGAATLLVPDLDSTRRDVAAPAPAHHPRLATQTRVRRDVRAAHLLAAAKVLEDTAAEACERYDVRTWADKLSVAPDADVVARTLARRYYERATRRAAYEGCLATLAGS